MNKNYSLTFIAKSGTIHLCNFPDGTMVDWGDGNASTITTGGFVTHTYEIRGYGIAS